MAESLLACMDASLDALEAVRRKLARGEWDSVDEAMDAFLAAFRPVWDGLEMAAISELGEGERQRLEQLDVLHRKAMRLMNDAMHRVGQDIHLVDDARLRLYRSAAAASEWK